MLLNTPLFHADWEGYGLAGLWLKRYGISTTVLLLCHTRFDLLHVDAELKVEWIGGMRGDLARIVRKKKHNETDGDDSKQVESSIFINTISNRSDNKTDIYPKQHGTSLKMRHQLVEPLPHQPFLPQKKTIEGSMFSGGSASQTRRILTCLKRPVFNWSRGTFFQVTYTSEI